MILCLETATPVCSVALNNGTATLALRECKGQNAHSEKITIFIDEILKEAGIQYHQLDAIAVSKGICYAADRPLMAVDTLHAMATGMRDKLCTQIQPSDLLVPMIDARRMEVYCAVFDVSLNAVKGTEALVVDEQSFGDLLKDHRIWLFGDGAPKLKDLFKDTPQIQIVDDFAPSAAYMAALSDQALKASDFVDVAYFEPYYLKDFIAGKPHVKGL